MKTIKLNVAVLLVLVATALTAVERPKVNMIPVNNDQAIVAVANDKAALMELSIVNAGGLVVYYKQTSEELKDYSKVFDFKNLEQGKYVLSLKINDTKVTNDFEVSGKGIKVGERKVNYAPYFGFENGILKLSYLNFGQDNLKLVIYGRNGLVYEKSLGKDFNVLKGLDLNKLDKGSYSVVLHSKDDAYRYNVVI